MFRKLKRSHLLHYGVSVASVAIALLLTEFLYPMLKLTPSPLFFAAVAVSAWYGGMGSGLLATVLSAVAIQHFFRDPASAFSVGLADILLLTVFGLVSLLISSLNDSRRRAVVAVQKNENFLRLIADSLPVSISYVDALERYRFNNRNYQEWFGRPIEDISGKHLKEILGEDTYKVISNYVKVALSGQQVTYETRLPYSNGGWRYVRATYVPDVGDRGEVKGFVALIDDISDRKQAQETLRESEERQKLALDAAQMGTWDWNLLTGSVRRDPMVDRIFGTRPGTFSGTYQAFVEDIHPHDRPRFTQAVGEAIQNQQKYDIEFRIVRPNGTIRWVVSKGQVLRNEAGVSVRSIGVCMDVTDLKNAAQALQVSEKRFKHIYDSNLIGLVFGDRDGNISEANNAFLNIIGYTQEDLRSHRVRWTNITPSEYRELDERAMHDSLVKGVCTPYETELIRKNGSRVPVLVGRAPLEDYTNMGISFVLDLSERKQAQAALSESEERLRLALEAAHMGMWDWDIATGTIVHSEIVDRLLGVEPGTFGGTYNSLIRMVHPDDRARFNHAAIATMEQGANFDIEFRVVQPSGAIAWVASIGKRLQDTAKNGDRLIGVCMDITPRKQIEEELHRREQEFKALAENAPDIIARMDGVGRYRYVNQEIASVTGIPAESFIGKTFAELGFPPELDRLWQQTVREVLQTGKESILEGDLPTPNGIRHYQSRLVPEMALDGSVEQAICISRDITDLKRAEEALRETNQTLKALIQSCPLGIMVLDVRGGVKMWNRASERMFGWSEAEAIGVELMNVPPERREELRSNIQQTLEGNPLMGVETQRQHKAGRLLDVALWSAPLRDAKGNLSYLSIVADISDRKRSQEALRQSEERFRTLVNSMDDIVFTLDRLGCYTAVFGRWLERTQLSPEMFIGKTARELLGREAAEVHERANQKALSGERVMYEWSFESAIGPQHCQTSLSPLSDANGEAIGIVGVVRDITDRYRAEQTQTFLAEASSVLASSLDYPTTLKSLANLVVPPIADYCVIYIVEEAGQIHRLAMSHIDPAGEQLLQELNERYSLDFSQDDGIVNVIRTGKPLLATDISEEMLQGMARDAEHLRILQELGCNSCTIVPLVARGRTLGAISFCATTESGRRYGTDDLMLMEELARRASFAIDNARLYRESQEANRMKDEFLAIVSHELRTPLNAMLGWAQLLRTRKFDEAMTQRALETIERNARAQTQLIEDLLDVSRILRGKVSMSLQPVDLSQAIEAALESLRPTAEAKQIELVKSVREKVGLVSGDFNRIQQVVWNLLSNAIKFTPQQGRVEVRLQRSRNLAEIQILDTGMGISPEFLPFVFERFRQADSTTTRSYGGLGLGLAIVRHLVELHGGMVRADSEGEGKGATFTVQFPLLIDKRQQCHLEEESAQERRAIAPESDDLPLHQLRVLVVDDEPDTLEFLATALSLAGANVRSVTSVKEALDAIAAEKPDVLVSDIGMPELDGYALIRQLRSEEGDTDCPLPAVALTAYVRDSDRSQALAAGFNQHVSKPIQPDELVAVVRGLVEKERG